MKVFTHFKQVSDLWWEARCGLPTASDFDKIVTPAKGKLSEQADGYMDQLIADIICQTPNYFTTLGRPISQAMQAGIDNEPLARRWYEMEMDCDVLEVGGCLSDDGRLWCSPDGLVGTEGGVEIKCPEAKTQVKYLRNGVLPTEYKPQVHGALIITGRPWWDFVSYHPPMPMLRVRVYPDDFTKLLADALQGFLEKYDKRLKEANLKGPWEKP